MGELTVPPSKIVQIKEEMQKEFDNIIEEVPCPSSSSTPSSVKTFNKKMYVKLRVIRKKSSVFNFLTKKY